ncbi:hypothetical protein CHU93_04395 [Sandarakinorhabdus cyanobacteriorum]|uniref:Ice-binding protein C-terminal domain-containing protein n=1 Tax=Sandarakinorhabdus cyanobacteriorum TaxID=1981098 RepID=A0A255YQ02_9SPHN|nr:PEPxxWA-CTERM sorting domain-containing protein [Sandarakinorhabdus cyanobacteriorum]OYQ31288.1 hypothetical protein CHU93_04395 [Sandarakinorhabdus cyanobacteriorum]
MRKFLVAATAALLAAVPANAVIVSGVLTGGNIVTNGGSFQVTNLAHIQANQVNSTNVLGINERQKVTLGAAQRVINKDLASGTTIANTLAAIAPLSTLIAAGTTVNSHLIILDPAGIQSRNATGSVTFNGRILGIILHDTGRAGANFVSTNGIFGAQGTTYGTLHSGLDGAPDAYSIGGAGNKTLTFTVSSTALVGDYVRVITAVPEPRSWAMILTGFGMVGFGLRRRRTAVAA